MPKIFIILFAAALIVTACCSVSFRWVPGDREENAFPILQVLVKDISAEPEETSEPSQAPETEPPETTQPPVLTPEEEILKLSNEVITYGPGTAENGNVPPYAPDAQARYGKYGAHFLEDEKGVIYLTFDCGYEYYSDGKSVTDMILDALKEKNVKAIFFVTGSYVEKNPELVQRMLDEGHALGNHSADHRQMPQLTLEEMEDAIGDLHETVKEKFGYSMKFFRPPEGAFSLRSLAATQYLGYETVHWSFAYADWNTADQPDPEDAKEKILSSHHDGAIYLLHAVSTTNARVLGDVIDGLRDMGYRLDLLK